MADHLPLPAGTQLGSRRRRGAPPGRPPVARAAHASDLQGQLEQVEEKAGLDAEPGVDELDTRVVLKLRGATRLKSGPMNRLKLTALGEGRGWTYAVLSTRESRDLLIELLAEYGVSQDGEHVDWDHPQTWAELLDDIEDISVYGREDRFDPELRQLSFDGKEPLDVLLWPSRSDEEAQTRIAEIQELVQGEAERDRSIRVMAIDPRPQTTVVRVAADRELLDILLNASWVERVRPPLRPDVTLGDILQATIPVPLADPAGEAIGVIDGIAVTANPLLTNVVMATRSFPDGHVFGGPDEHGTGVAAAAAWGDLDFLVGPGNVPGAHPVLNARVLEPDQGGLVVAGQAHTTIADAIRWLVSEHKVRVVNISINRTEPPDALLRSELTTTVDTLARELDVVVVVSAGNRLKEPSSGWLAGYPGYLVDEDSGVAEPGDAALAVTVGATARRDRPGGRHAQSHVAIAPAGAPSPFSRSGPTRGHTSAGTLKPEFSHHGGNWAHDHQTNQIQHRDPGIAVVTAIKPTGDRFLGMETGTSFAAPAVARETARIATRYPNATSNLLRALLALSARHRANPPTNGVDPLRLSAYGQPDADRIIESGGANVILTIETTMSTNAVVIHPIPIPYEFAEGVSRRTFRVALAFDPPVRRSRREYIAGQMSVELVRGLDENEVERRYSLQPTIAEAQADSSVHRLNLPSGKLRPALQPGPTRLASNTLVRRDFDDGSWDPDDEHYFLVVTHNLSPWTTRQRREYGEQRYALAVQLVDEGRTNLDLHSLVRAELRTRVRTRRRG